MGLLLAFLKMLGTAAAKGAVGLGKAALTGAKAGAKGIGALAKAGIEKTDLGKLVNAFATTGSKGGNTAQELKGTAFDPEKYGAGNMQLGQELQGQGNMPPMDYDINPQTQQVMRVPMGTSQLLPKTPQEYSNFPPTTPTIIPQQYLNMAQAGQQPQLPQQAGQSPDVGAIRGFIDALTGQPQPGGLSAARQGRKTAYYAGGLIPKIVMSKLGQPSPAEETSRQQQIETSKTKEATPEYKKDLQEATIRLSNPNLSETDKTMIYQQLVSVYPERSAEIKRIFFPQSSDNFSDLLQGIIAGYGGGVNAR
jgi:hypothetical protein